MSARSLNIKKLGLIAGAGTLPLNIAQSSKAPVFIVGFEGQEPAKDLLKFPHALYPLGYVGAVIERLKSENITHVIMAGSLKRPGFKDLKVDSRGAKVLKKIALQSLTGMGDDKLLTILERELESEGFKILSTQDVLPQIFVKKGILTHAKPTKEQKQDAALGFKILEALSPFDIGQSVAVQNGLILALEGVEGTDPMIVRAAKLQKTGLGAILVKAAKKGQNTNVDLPTIGPETVKTIIKSGFSGMAVSAENTQIIEKDQVVDLANRANIVIFAV